MSYLIIGVDPGHTIGLAALDLSGRPLRTAHIQQGGFGAALAELESWGTPSMIASDVRPASELVLKLASAFNASLFVPEHPWREEDKRATAAQMFEQFSHVVQNVHERDALSAAVQAWRHHQNTLRMPAQNGLSPDDTEVLRHLLLQGVRHSAALEMIKQLRTPPVKEEKIATPLRVHHITNKSDTVFSSLSQERVISELRKRISFLEAERESFTHRIRLLENGVMSTRMADRDHQRMVARIALLESQLNSIYGRRKKGKESRTGTRVQSSALSSKQASSPARPTSISARPAQQIPRPAYSAPLSSTHSSSLAPKSAVVIPTDADADLKKLNALRLSKMIEEYRRTRVISETSR